MVILLDLDYVNSLIQHPPFKPTIARYVNPPYKPHSLGFLVALAFELLQRLDQSPGNRAFCHRRLPLDRQQRGAASLPESFRLAPRVSLNL